MYTSLILTISVFIILITTVLYILQYCHDKLKNNQNSNNLAEEINKLLPQTQCGQCDFPGCRPYAEAISENKAEINKCPPGGQATVDNLAQLLNKPSLQLALDNSSPNDNNTYKIAKIIEEECIGCMLCIKACPVDAIVGANKLMHTVISDQCTGCDLCVEPCPMDCIIMVNQDNPIRQYEHAYPS